MYTSWDTVLRRISAYGHAAEGRFRQETLPIKRPVEHSEELTVLNAQIATERANNAELDQALHLITKDVECSQQVIEVITSHVLEIDSSKVNVQFINDAKDAEELYIAFAPEAFSDKKTASEVTRSIILQICELQHSLIKELYFDSVLDKGK